MVHELPARVVVALELAGDRPWSPSCWRGPVGVDQAAQAGRLGCPRRSVCCQGSRAMRRSCLRPGPCWGNRHGQCFQATVVMTQPGFCRACGRPPGFDAAHAGPRSCTFRIDVAGRRCRRAERTECRVVRQRCDRRRGRSARGRRRPRRRARVVASWARGSEVLLAPLQAATLVEPAPPADRLDRDAVQRAFSASCIRWSTRPRRWPRSSVVGRAASVPASPRTAVPGVGFEPTSLSGGAFETTAYAVPPTRLGRRQR